MAYILDGTMFNIAVFPGQGSQRKSMGKDFVEQYPLARQTFEEASEALKMDISAVCNDENDERLNLTEFAQPCILTTEIAMYRSLQSAYGLSPEVFGGHSLGEYSALVAAGVIPFSEAVKMVHYRGQLMQKASPVGLGGMAAVIGEPLALEAIENLTKENNVDIANDNSPTQVVLSGEKNALNAVCEALLAMFQGQTGFRAVPLEVSAPFHSRHMAAMEASFRTFLENVSHTFDTTSLNRVTSNVTGKYHLPHIDSLIDSLTLQISGRVRWRDNMSALLSRAAGVVEIGPGRPLGGFFKGLGVAVSSIIDLRSAQRVFEPKPAV